MNMEKFAKELVKQSFVDNNRYLNDYQKAYYKQLIDECSTPDEVAKIIGTLMLQCLYIEYQLNYGRRNTFRIWF